MEHLTVFNTVDSLRERLRDSRTFEQVSFVPTMGALHEGHLELVRKAFSMSEIVVVSIFVNPTQFNNKSDLINYPRTLEKDVEMLKSVGEVIVFAPSVEEMYPDSFEEIELELGGLDTVMEGEFRPGHFKGVLNVVKRLFDIVEPDFALFGEKDFQQLSIIQFMVKKLNLAVQIIPCETIRDTSGLAKSSRNQRLSEKEKQEALIIYETLKLIIEKAKEHSPTEVLGIATEFFNSSSLQLEYLEIVDPSSLIEVEIWVPGTRACIAAYCGSVRLIDNMEVVELP